MHYFAFIMINHFIADFLCQSRKMGENKSTSMFWLSMHILVYTIVLGFFSSFFFAPIQFVNWLVINSVLHFITDFITSRMTTYFYKKQNMKYFWSTIGFDQLVHGLCLFYTSIYFGLS